MSSIFPYGFATASPVLTLQIATHQLRYEQRSTGGCSSWMGSRRPSATVLAYVHPGTDGAYGANIATVPAYARPGTDGAYGTVDTKVPVLGDTLY